MSYWPGTPRPQRRSSPLYLSPRSLASNPSLEVTPVRLWPRKGERAQVQQEQAEARAQIVESQTARRQVEAKDPEVHHMNSLLAFYSDRNGFADAFEKLIDERGRHRAAGG